MRAAYAIVVGTVLTPPPALKKESCMKSCPTCNTVRLVSLILLRQNGRLVFSEMLFYPVLGMIFF